LCAYAQRNDVTWRQLLTATGLHRRARDMRHIGWAARLHPHEITTLSDATGIDPDILHAMTLEHFAPLGLHIARRPARTDHGTLRRTARPKRFCPQCLHDSDGRWQLAWLLGWTFACTRHQCLLADTCPRCQRPPMRPAPLTDVIPNLGRCTQAGGRHGHTVCGADLRSEEQATPAAPHTIAVQHIIDDLIAGDTTSFTLHDQTTVTPARVLADLRALARDIAHTSTIPAPHPGVLSTHGDLDHQIERVADSFVTATEALRCTDIPSAADLLRERITSRTPLVAVSRRVELAADTSARHAIAGAVELGALDADLPVTDVLRHRTCSSRPCVPRRPAATLAVLTRALPTLLWPPWVAHILGAGADDPVSAAMLSCAVAHVGTAASTRDIASMLGNTAGGVTGLCAALQRIERRPDRPEVLCRIIALADQIAATTTRIDYHRRRGLDYTNLLADIDAGLTGEGGDALRCLAFEHLSGMPMIRAPWFSDTSGFGLRCRQMAARNPLQDPALVLALRQFLDGRGMGSEPITAVPPVPVLTAA
jgi:hypothetical protein